MIARGAFAEVSDGAGSFKVPNPPFRMSGSRVEARSRIAQLGEDGGALLKERLGLSEDAVNALRDAGNLI